jgi:hypothetical protein
MLLAAGVKLSDYEMVPIIIDPDLAAADLTRTVKLMQDYVKVRDNIDVNTTSSNGFFHTKINMEILPSGRIPVEHAKDKLFKDYIGLSLMKNEKGKEDSNYALASMLFSEKNLEAKMDVGFKGNPNMGSVVLNQISSSQEYDAFAHEIKKGDRIFIVSSIFGGTGASGFPLLVKKIREPKEKDENETMRNVPIGAVTVLPYFSVQSDETSAINSTTFTSKAKAALSYYDSHLNEVNSLYYIGDKKTKAYKNSEGGETQRNEAHFVELASALAIVDFAAQSDDKFSIQNGQVEGHVFKEFGILNETDQIIFNDLAAQTNGIIKKPLTQFLLFAKYIDEQFKNSYHIQPWAIDHGIDDTFASQQYFQTDLKGIMNAYIEWLKEMASNNRAFTPYDLSVKKKKLFTLIKGEEEKKSSFLYKQNYALFDNTLNKLQTQFKENQSKPLNYFMTLFYEATAKLVKTKFNL